MKFWFFLDYKFWGVPDFQLKVAKDFIKKKKKLRKTDRDGKDFPARKLNRAFTFVSLVMDFRSPVVIDWVHQNTLVR